MIHKTVTALLLATAAFAAGAAAAERPAEAPRAELSRLDAAIGADPASRLPAGVVSAAVGQEIAGELRLQSDRESLTGQHLRYVQYIDGREVRGSELLIGRSGDASFAITPQLGTREPVSRAAAIDISQLSGSSELSRRELFLMSGGRAVAAVEVIAAPQGSSLRTAYYFERESGRLIEQLPLFFALDATARLFTANPVTVLNDPGLLDQNDSATAVPAAAYQDVVLHDLIPAAPLGGPFVQLVDTSLPNAPPVQSSGDLSVDRSQRAFEEVMAYHHLDQAQRYLQSLGYVGSRRVMDYVLPVDAHALNGADSSFFVITSPGQGRLEFGDGGVDDAEDPDIVLHELAHGIAEWAAPGSFVGTYGSQARALAEGFGDYWAFSSGYAASIESGRDPFCIAEWDARCAGSAGCRYPSGADCLRRVDSSKTMADYVDRDQAGTEHQNGEIWSSALRAFFLNLVERYGVEEGRRRADTVVIESLFALPAHPTFRVAAQRMIQADLLLYGGGNGAAICTAMVAARIFDAGSCSTTIRSEPVFYPATQRDVPIPDANRTGITLTRFIGDAGIIERAMVTVNIEHENRGDLRVVLVSPAGTPVVLQEVDRSDRGTDVRVTWGLDAEPAESLDVLRGEPAAGEWRLTVIDVLGNDVGRVIDWGLQFVLAGAEPRTVRGSSEQSRMIIAVAHLRGAADSFFTSDLVVANTAAAGREVEVLFTPAGENGLSSFSSFRMSLQPGQTVRLQDFVSRVLLGAGGGTAEVRAPADVIVWTGLANDAPSLPSRVRVPFARPENLAGSGGDQLDVAFRTGTGERLNIGLSETAGRPAGVTVSLFAANGQPLTTFTRDLLPLSLVQIPVDGEVARLATRAVVSRIAGSGTVAAYVSTVRFDTGEATFVMFQRADAQGVIVPMIAAEGALGTVWRSELLLANHGETAATVDAAIAGEHRQLVLAAGETRAFDDAVREIFSRSGRVAVTFTLPRGVTAHSRVIGRAQAEFRQEIEPLPLDAANHQQIAGVDVSATRRTNLGLIETTGGGSAAVRIRLSDASGVPLDERLINVEPGAFVQLPLQSEVDAGRVEIDKLSGSGTVVAYASVVENSSGDAVFIPAEQLPLD